MNRDDGRVDDDPVMRWNGWGDPDRAKDLPLAIRTLLPLLLGRIRKPEPPVDIADVRLPPVMLTDDDIVAFTAVVGSHGIDLSSEARIRHAGGRSTPDL